MSISDLSEIAKVIGAGAGGDREFRESWFVKLIGRTTISVLLIFAYLSALGVVWNFFGEVLRSMHRDQPWLFWAAIAGPLLLVLIFSVLPTVLRAMREKRLHPLADDGKDLREGYYLLRPYEESESERYFRPDGAGDEALSWLKNSADSVLYFSGASGAGKTSLINAYVIPKLRADGWRILKVRGLGDPLDQLKTALLAATDLFKDPLEATSGIHAILNAIVNETQRSAVGPLLIVVDQFEEHLIVGNGSGTTEYKDFLSRISKEPVPGFILLHVFRDDYRALIFKEGYPDYIPRKNGFELSPFSRREAETFLRDGPQKLDIKGYEALFRGLDRIEQAKGIYRPITLNMVGFVISKHGHELSIDPSLLIENYFTDAIERGPSRDFAPSVLQTMITRDGTKQLRNIEQIVEATGIESWQVRATLVDLERDQLVRRLPHESWEISHDFLARLVSQIVGRSKSGWSPRYVSAILAFIIAGWAAGGAVILPVVAEARAEKIKANYQAAIGYSHSAMSGGEVIKAAKFALFAWPSDSRETDPQFQLPEVRNALSDALYTLKPHRVLRIHDGPVSTIALHPNGKIVASGSWDKTIQFWDIHTGKNLYSLTGFKSYIHSITFSPDGKHLAVAIRNHRVQIWDVENKELFHELGRRSRGVNHIEYSPDGKLLAYDGSSTVELWDAGELNFIRAIPQKNKERALAFTFSRNSEFIATGHADYRGKVYDLRGSQYTLNKEIGKYDEGPRPGRISHSGVRAVAFSTVDDIVALGNDQGDVEFWNFIVPMKVASLPNRESPVNRLSFSEDARYLAVATDDGGLELWHVLRSSANTRINFASDIVEIFSAHVGKINDVKFSDDGRYLFTAGNDSTLRMWDLEPREQTSIIDFPKIWRSRVFYRRSTALAPGGSHLSVGTEQGEVLLWRAEQGSMIQIGEHSDRPISSLDFFEDAEILIAGSTDGLIKTYNTEKGEKVDSFVWGIKKGSLNHIGALCDAGRYFATSSEGSLIFVKYNWIYASFEPETHAGRVTVVKTANCARVIGVYSDGTVRIIDPEDGSVVKEIKSTAGAELSAPSHGNNFAILSLDQPPEIWSAETGERLSSLTGVVNKVTAANFSRDGTLFATGSQSGEVEIWHWQTGTLVASFSAHSIPFRSIEFSQSSERIATVQGNGPVSLIREWDLNTGADRIRWVGERTVEVFSYSDDGIKAVLSRKNGDSERDGGLLLVNLPGLPTGNAFEIVCRWLPVSDGETEDALPDQISGRTVHVEGRVCENPSDRPTPFWMQAVGGPINSVDPN